MPLRPPNVAVDPIAVYLLLSWSDETTEKSWQAIDIRVVCSMMFYKRVEKQLVTHKC